MIEFAELPGLGDQKKTGGGGLESAAPARVDVCIGQVDGLPCHRAGSVEAIQHDEADHPLVVGEATITGRLSQGPEGHRVG